MAFSEQVKAQAFARARARCECTRQHDWLSAPHHGGRCNKLLIPGFWEAHHILSEAFGGPDTLTNCEALCAECHQLTRSYGG